MEQSASYQRGTRSVDDLGRDIADFWKEFDRSELLRGEVAKAEIDLTDLKQLERQGAYDFREEDVPLAVGFRWGPP
jgi:hypothetical protein